MRHKTTFTAALAALLLLATPATTPVPTTAEANTARSGTLVWWEHSYFRGASVTVPAPAADYCWPLGVLVGSVENDTDLTLQLFSDGHCETPLTEPPAGLVPPDTAAPLLEPLPFSFDDDPAPGPRALRQLLERLHAHPERAWTTAAMARAAGVGVRAVQKMFARHLDTTPQAYLRRIRLARAHTDLLAADPAATSVRQIAARWGITHRGRFAADYHHRYGEPPTDTLHRA